MTPTTPTKLLDKSGVSGAGTGVDIFGGPAVDPTRNVLDLVKAESKYQDGMRAAGEKYNKGIRQAENRRLEELASAETRRVNDLDAQRVRYEARIAEDLRVNVKTTSDQLAGQLIKETGALNNQIATLNTSFTNQFATLSASLTNQISSMTVGINTRLADLEKFRWETGGKTSVADPALTNQISQMANSIAELKDVSIKGVGSKEEKSSAKDTGMRTATLIISAVVGTIGIFTGIGGLALGVTIFLLHH